MKKAFNCVDMKQKIQEKIFEETKNLSKKEQIDYFHRAAAEFWAEIEKARSEGKSRKPE